MDLPATGNQGRDGMALLTATGKIELPLRFEVPRSTLGEPCAARRCCAGPALLHNPVVTAPIVGPRTVEQLTENIRALKLVLSEETLRRLDDIWPGYGKGAPEAYAW